MQFPASIALAISVALGTNVPPPTPPPPPQAQTVKEYVQDYFADEPIMIAVAQCESHFRQYDLKGAIYRGVQNNLDVGVMQINEYYHLSEATKLGYDIYSVSGNVAYARYLYERQGTAPWSASEPCWGKKVASVKTAKALATIGK